MGRPTRAEVEEENAALLDSLEDLRDQLDDVLSEYREEPEPETD
jgi:hypothetical protein